MEKRMYFNANGVFYEDDEYLLKALTEEDKYYYLALYKEDSALAKVIDEAEFEDFAEFTWKRIAERDEINISIFRKEDGEYIGNITIRDLESRTPELGIDIFGKHRRQGHAYKTITLVKQQIKKICDIDYLLIRILSDNVASQKLFHKLGVVEIGREDNEYVEFIRKLKEENGDKFNEIYGDRAKQLQEMADKNYIGRYRLLN